MAKYKLNPLLKHGFDQSGGIEIEEIHGSDINIEELNNLKNTTGNIQNQLNIISAKLKSGKAIDITNKDINVKYDDVSIKLDQQGRLYAVPFDPTELQNSITNLENKVNAFYDIDVHNWEEFVAAAELSKEFSLRIHLRHQINVWPIYTTTRDKFSIDLTNCEIHGHYNIWNVNGICIRLDGSFARFRDVMFKGADNGQPSVPAFTFTGKNHGQATCSFYFEDCRFYNFLEVSDAVFLSVYADKSHYSLHFAFIRCIINGESVDTPLRTLLIHHYAATCVSLKVVNLLFANGDLETKKIALVGNKMPHDLFSGDGSCEYVERNTFSVTTKEYDSATSWATNDVTEEYPGYKPDHFYQWGVETDQSQYWDEY
jgi:hypothetical protein